MNRSDSTSLTLGLVFAMIALLGLWSAIGTFSWDSLEIMLPIALIVIGVLGINSARRR